jgi:hypothetical protein
MSLKVVGNASPILPSENEASMLSPHDILHTLNTLSGVKYDDVRNDIVQGLLELLQVCIYIYIFINTYMYIYSLI